jgi:hypothetical protein
MPVVVRGDLKPQEPPIIHFFLTKEFLLNTKSDAIVYRFSFFSGTLEMQPL